MPDRRKGPTPGTKRWAQRNSFSPQVLHEAVDKANHILEVYGTELHFSLHEASGEMIVRVINTKDESVIREIPPERVLDFVADVKEMLGFIIDKLI
ncbi:MAG: flagellar protein FlaG [Candidatus Syntrophopropionicum ammoniitolerans]